VATFQERIEDYVGTVTDTDALSNWLTDAARLVVSLLPPAILNKFQVSTTVDVAGTTCTDQRLVSLVRTGRACMVLGPEQEHKITDTGSFFYATTYQPVALIKEGKAYIYPVGGTPVMWSIPFPTVAFGDSTITNYPIWMESLIVLHAAQSFLRGAMTTLMATLPTPPPSDDLSITAYLTQINTYLIDQEDIEMAMGIIKEVEMIVAQWSAERSLLIQNYVQQVQAILPQVDVLKTQIGTLRQEYDQLLQLNLGLKEEKNATA